MAVTKKNPKGAGNKEGSIRPNFTMYTSEDDIKEFMTWVKENYKKSDKLATWYGDHIFGKAIQPLGNPDGSPLTITFDSAFKE